MFLKSRKLILVAATLGLVLAGCSAPGSYNAPVNNLNGQSTYNGGNTGVDLNSESYSPNFIGNNGNSNSGYALPNAESNLQGTTPSFTTPANPASAASGQLTCPNDFKPYNVVRTPEGKPDYARMVKGSYQQAKIKVQKGDSLFLIGYLTGHTATEIAGFNGISPNTILPDGAVLVVNPQLCQRASVEATQGQTAEVNSGIVPGYASSALNTNNLSNDFATNASAYNSTQPTNLAGVGDNLTNGVNKVSSDVKSSLGSYDLNNPNNFNQGSTTNLTNNAANLTNQATNNGAVNLSEVGTAVVGSAVTGTATVGTALTNATNLNTSAPAVVDIPSEKLSGLTNVGTQNDVQAASPAKPNPNDEYISSNSNKNQGIYASGQASGSSALAWPHKGKVVQTFSSSAAARQGIEISGNIGDRVYAATDGVVQYAGNRLAGFGNMLIIQDNTSKSNKIITVYGYNSKLLVKENQKVKKGQLIALMGNTGTDSSKLFFAVRINGKPVDPLKYLAKR